MGLLMAKLSVCMGSKACVAGVTRSTHSSPVLCAPQRTHRLVAVLCSGRQAGQASTGRKAASVFSQHTSF